MQVRAPRVYGLRMDAAALVGRDAFARRSAGGAGRMRGKFNLRSADQDGGDWRVLTWAKALQLDARRSES